MNNPFPKPPQSLIDTLGFDPSTPTEKCDWNTPDQQAELRKSERNDARLRWRCECLVAHAEKLA